MLAAPRQALKREEVMNAIAAVRKRRFQASVDIRAEKERSATNESRK